MIVPASRIPTIFEAITSSVCILAAFGKTCGSVEKRYIAPKNWKPENKGCAQYDLAVIV
jgi:hypothetical protein